MPLCSILDLFKVKLHRHAPSPGRNPAWRLPEAHGNYTTQTCEILGVSKRHIGEIITGKRSITADTALRPAIFSGTDPQSWMNFQTHYGLTVAEENLSERLKMEVVRYAV